MYFLAIIFSITINHTLTINIIIDFRYCLNFTINLAIRTTPTISISLTKPKMSNASQPNTTLLSAILRTNLPRKRRRSGLRKIQLLLTILSLWKLEKATTNIQSYRAVDGVFRNQKAPGNATALHPKQIVNTVYVTKPIKLP